MLIGRSDSTHTQGIRRAAAPVELILSCLDGVRRSGSGWVASCPAHDDRLPSLKVDEGEDGRALIFCHAGCSNESILDALGLPMYALFPRGSRAASRTTTVPTTPTYSDLSRGTQRRLYVAQRKLVESPETLRRLRDEKGVSAHVAERAGLGWDHDRRELLIPYVLADGRTLVARVTAGERHPGVPADSGKLLRPAGPAQALAKVV
jgi:hypothetical protein